MRKSGYREISGPGGLLAHLAPFEGNSMSAYSYPKGIQFGRLSDYTYRMAIQLAHDMGKLRYIVYSYATPIAFVVDTDTDDTNPILYRIPFRYGVTSSKHQTYTWAWTGKAQNVWRND